MARSGFFFCTRELHTIKKIDLVDITTEVQKAVTESRMHHGRVFIDALHTTAAICLQEHEDGLIHDMRQAFRLLKTSVSSVGAFLHDKSHAHGSANAVAHLMAMVYGSTISLSLVDGKLMLGRYQKIFFVEFDGPRPRPSDGREDFPPRQFAVTIMTALQ